MELIEISSDLTFALSPSGQPQSPTFLIALESDEKKRAATRFFVSTDYKTTYRYRIKF